MFNTPRKGHPPGRRPWLHRSRPHGAVHWPALMAALLVTLFTLVLVWGFLEWVLPWLMAALDPPSLHLRLALTALWTAGCLALLWRWWRRRGRTGSAR